MDKLAIFIDGNYLSRISRDQFRTKIDFQLLTQEILKSIIAKTSLPFELLRIYYYDAPPYQHDPPTDEEKIRFSKTRSFFDVVQKYPRTTLRLGKLVFKGNDNENKPIFQQKQVDLMLGLDIALLSAKKLISHLAIISGDSDLRPAVEVAKNEGVIVWLFYAPRDLISGNNTCANDLWKIFDERIEMDSKFIKSVEMHQNNKIGDLNHTWGK